MYKVVKRDGTVADFDVSKITKAIKSAFDDNKKDVDEMVLNMITLCVVNDFENKIENELIKVEDIQDSVESILIKSGYTDIAKSYILYRKQREKVRNIKSNILNYKDLVDSYLKVSDWRVKENSTVTYSVGGLILSNSGAITANYWLSEIYDEEVANAHRNADIHLHDLSMLTGYCAGWSLKQLIREGLGGVPGKITSSPASHLSTLCNQMVNFLGIMQNEWAGAQAFSSFDTYLAPFVKVDNLSYKEVKQCIQSFIFGVNTPSRWGCVDQNTEILTVDGFKRYDELSRGDMIYTWNDGRLEIQPVNEIVIKPYKGKMHGYSIPSRGYIQYVSPDHRVLCKKFNSDEYVIKHSEEIIDVPTPFSFPSRFKSSELDADNMTDEEVEFAAIIYTDGSFDFRNGKIHKVSIFKSPNRDGNDMIISLAKKLNLEYKKYEGCGSFNTPVNKYVFYGDNARKICQLTGDKVEIDRKFINLSSRQSDIFLKTWSAFDGNYEKFQLQYDNETIGDQLQHIALRAGYTSYKWSRPCSGRKPSNYIKIRQCDTIKPKKRFKEDYDGIIWCPNVNNGTAVFRKGSCVYISGQCQAPFSNITLDWTVPNDLAELPAIVGGKDMDFCYKDCKKEMDMVNKAFIETMIEGDANGRGFQYPIPTYSITRDFDWSETENNRLLFEMTAKYGTPYFSNYINSDMQPSDVRSMCCRLRLDLRELRKKSGGFFGSGESTGSVGVVTINMPRIAYLAKDEKDFYDRLAHMMDIAARSLKTKRNVVTKLLEGGLYPYTKRYLGTFSNHFSTIATIGMNEMGLNAKWLRKDMTHPETQQFSKNVLNFMRERLSDYQEMYGDLYNLEAAPAESTTYRFAKHDKERYPDIITAAQGNGTPYYTNSSHLPVGYTEDIFEALDIQDELQTLYTSGTVFHAFIGEKMPTWKSAADLVRKIAQNYKLPYYTISPTYSVCKNHGYLVGEQYTCPECGEATEVYSRITGYYRPVQNWNDGKRQEFSDRVEYNIAESKLGKKAADTTAPAAEETVEEQCSAPTTERILVATKTCPNCKMACAMLDKEGVSYRKVYVEDDPDTVKAYGVKQAPTLIVLGDNAIERIENASNIKKYIASLK